MDWQYGIKVGTDPAVIEVLKNGYNPTVLPHDKTEFANNLSARQFPVITSKEIKELLSKDRIEEVFEETDIHDINPLTLVIKPNKNRLCIDTSRILNKTIPTQKFRMRGLEHRLSNFSKGSWMAKIDLKNGYLHIPLHKDFRKYTCFKWNGHTYRYKWLPFGINDAPRIFQKIANEVCLSLLRDGHFVETYLDDFWIEGRTYEECKRTLQTTLERLKKFGFTCNYKKSQLSPTQRMEYIGFEFNSNSGSVTLRQETIATIKKTIKNARSAPTARNLRKMMGTIAYATTIDQRLKPFTMKTYKQIGNKQREELIPWSQRAINQIEKISTLLPLAEYKSRDSFKDKCIITSDASKEGYAFWDNITNKDSWIEWNTTKHSTWTELSAAIRAIKSRSVKTHLNLLRTDNTSTMAILNSGSSKNETLNELTMDLANWAFKHKIHFSADYIEGRLNTRADAHSRRIHDKIKTPPGEINTSQLLIPSFPTITRHSTEISTDKSEKTEQQQKTPPDKSDLISMGQGPGQSQSQDTTQNATPELLLRSSKFLGTFPEKIPRKFKIKKIRGTPNIDLPPELPTKISRALSSIPDDVVITNHSTYKQIPITTKQLAQLSNKEAKKMQINLKLDFAPLYLGTTKEFIPRKEGYFIYDFKNYNDSYKLLDDMLLHGDYYENNEEVIAVLNFNEGYPHTLWFSYDKGNYYETFCFARFPNNIKYDDICFILATKMGGIKCYDETATSYDQDRVFETWRNFRENPN